MTPDGSRVADEFFENLNDIVWFFNPEDGGLVVFNCQQHDNKSGVANKTISNETN